MRFAPGIIAAAALLAAAPASRLAAQEAQGDRWSWHGALAAGKTLDVRNINGSITADAAGRSEIEVTATKRAGRHGNTADVQIRQEDTPDGVRICVIYPGRSFEDGCRGRGSRGRNWGDDDDRNDTEVEFTVHVPRGVELSAGTVNGDVLARGMTARVSGRSVNGTVEIETAAGEAEGESVNGSVHAIVRGEGREALRFSSVNGAVDVTLPRGINADFDAATVNGSITSDFEITLQGGVSLHRQRLQGRIGQGGRTLRLNTVNGSIRLRAAT